MTHECVTQKETGKKMTRKERRNAAPFRGGPLDTPELRLHILGLLRQGATITEICARDDMPPLVTLFDMRRRDPDFAAEFTAAMADHAETLISDAMDQNIGAVDAAEAGDEPVDPSRGVDPARAKSADQYLQATLRYAGAIAPAKYGQLVKLSDAQIGNGLQISITSYATNGSADSGSGS